MIFFKCFQNQIIVIAAMYINNDFVYFYLNNLKRNTWDEVNI